MVNVVELPDQLSEELWSRLFDSNCSMFRSVQLEDCSRIYNSQLGLKDKMRNRLNDIMYLIPLFLFGYLYWGPGSVLQSVLQPLDLSDNLILLLGVFVLLILAVNVNIRWYTPGSVTTLSPAGLMSMVRNGRVMFTVRSCVKNDIVLPPLVCW